MPKKHKNLFEQIVHIDNLRDAYRKTSKGKKQTSGYLKFKEFSESNLKAIQEELINETYEIGPYRCFMVYEPKPREIKSLGFKDRLVQHALCNIISPIMESTLLPYTFACRRNKGTHAGVKHIQAMLRSEKPTHFLKTDFSKFFASIPRDVVYSLYERKIGCKKTLDLISKIIPIQGRGIPIGSLTSQLSANLIGGLVDRFIHFDLGHRSWARYMDDIVILESDVNRLKESFEKIKLFSKSKLGLDISKWQVSSVSRGINFLGYRIWPTHKLIRKDSVTRAKRKLKRYVNDSENLKMFCASWLGHIGWADCMNLKINLVKLLESKQ